VNEEGWDSVVAIVDREWVLRVARPSRFAALSFPEEAELTRALEPRLPLPIPVILRCTQEWALTRYIRGKPFSGRRGGAQLATFLRALHATHADLPEHDKEHDRERWVRHVLPRLEGDERRQAESLLDEHLGAGHPLVVGHTDLLAPHVLVQRRTISGVIDWSDARRADPAIDLAWALYGTPRRFADEFAAAYGVDAVPRRRAEVFWALEPWYEVVHADEPMELAAALSHVRERLPRAAGKPDTMAP